MLTNVVYTDFEAIDEYLDQEHQYYGYYPSTSIVDDEYATLPMIVNRAESERLGTNLVAIATQNRRAYETALAYWENEKYMFPEYTWIDSEPKIEDFR